MAIKKRYLGALLIDIGMITHEQLDECLKVQKDTGDQLSKVLKAKGFVTEQQLMEILEFQLGIPSVNLDTATLSPKLAKYIPVSLARKHRMVPIKVENDSLFIAMEDALDFIALEDARVVSGMEIVPRIASEQAIESAINKMYGNVSAENAIKELSEEGVAEKSDEEETSSQISNAPIVRLVTSIFEQAVKAKASDIHVEPSESNVRVRMRIDGQLLQILTIPKKAQSAVITRLKIIGNMDIAEKRVPQDGRYRLMVNGNEIDVRMSSLPTVHGEKIVMRLLDKENFLISKDQLGFSKDNIKKFDALLNNPHGIILVTGPTGSGKSTTLYAMLSELNKGTENIITVEDPVEYTVGGVNQVQVNTKAGLSFSSGLRSMLRQDPDIIMIGEIRDQETVDIAIRAAITGHLVLSTIHTNDAPGTISRLVNMGIPSYMLAASLVGIMAQRLVRKICPACKTKYTPNKFELGAAGLPPSYNKEIYIGKGCSNCNNTGYKGRTAVHEILIVDREVREMIAEGVNVDEIRDYAISKQHMNTLAAECISLMAQGITTLEEVIKTSYSNRGETE
jgi:type IV pilus assembly protein PilB